MERVWAMGYLKGSNDVAFGYDEGTISIQFGRESPSVSMDNTGKMVWAKHNEIQTANLRAEELVDGVVIQFSSKDLGTCELYPQSLAHSPNGRFVVVCGDGEYVIYTALAWRNKGFGQALEFVWAQDSNEYAIRESTSRVRLFKSFKEKSVNIPSQFSIEGIFGGTLLGVKSSGFIAFFDWEANMIRRVDVDATNVFWSESDTVAITTAESIFVLVFHRELVGDGNSDDDNVFELVAEIPDVVVTGGWVGDCFMYTTGSRLNYVVGTSTETLAHFDTPSYFLGYLQHNSRIIVCDKQMNVTSYGLPVELIAYQTSMMRGDPNADNLLQLVPSEHHNRIAKFLESLGHAEKALDITKDPEHKFELCMQLNRLELAVQLAVKMDHASKWTMIGDKALEQWNVLLF